MVTVQPISALFSLEVVKSLYFLNLKFQASSYILWMCNRVCVGPGRKPEDSFSRDAAPLLLQIKNPSTATFFTNRALCYLRLKQWELAIQDCRRALELDRRLVKGHYFMGLALTELNHNEEAIASLSKGTSQI